MEQEEISVDVLFVGLTRPTTLLGVPMGAFVFELCFVSCLFIAVGNPLYMLLTLPIHGVLYAVSYNDPGIFDDISLFFKTLGLCLNFRFWGCRSFSPMPLQSYKLFD